MRKLFLLALVLSSFLLACQDGDVSYEEDVVPLIEENTTPARSLGSCNFIDYGSRCIDYVGGGVVVG